MDPDFSPVSVLKIDWEMVDLISAECLLINYSLGGFCVHDGLWMVFEVIRHHLGDLAIFSSGILQILNEIAALNMRLKHNRSHDRSANNSEISGAF